MEDSRDLEREREDLLRLIKDRADVAILGELALVPKESRWPESVTVTTSTEGTRNACAK